MGPSLAHTVAMIWVQRSEANRVRLVGPSLAHTVAMIWVRMSEA